MVTDVSGRTYSPLRRTLPEKSPSFVVTGIMKDIIVVVIGLLVINEHLAALSMLGFVIQLVGLVAYFMVRNNLKSWDELQVAGMALLGIRIDVNRGGGSLVGVLQGGGPETGGIQVKRSTSKLRPTSIDGGKGGAIDATITAPVLYTAFSGRSTSKLRSGAGRGFSVSVENGGLTGTQRGGPPSPDHYLHRADCNPGVEGGSGSGQLYSSPRSGAADVFLPKATRSGGAAR